MSKLNIIYTIKRIIEIKAEVVNVKFVIGIDELKILGIDKIIKTILYFPAFKKKLLSFDSLLKPTANKIYPTMSGKISKLLMLKPNITKRNPQKSHSNPFFLINTP
ncbi:hypothetical protein CSC2_03160 [Clostridium zeae]|uniref:Uncharacterized protein n=1 Tax=Clostridium zeae TaxID=2759022 RepID=A0ABQ1E4W8_9CLOT|nr:hypothetical protein CSC2_03160 [Clostridium zeae]